MVFLVNLARIVFSPLLEPLKAYFGATEATIGLLATFVWVGSASPRLLVGYALTKIPRHFMVLAAGGILTVSAAFASVAQSIEMLMVGGFCLGLASGPYFMAANPILSELFPEQVGNVLGIHGMSSQFAAVTAAPLVVLVLSVGSWRLTFQLLAVVAALATIILFVVAYRTDLPDAGEGDRHFIRAARRQWRTVAVGIVLVGSVSLVWNGVFNFYVTYLISSKSLSQPAAQGLLTALFAAGIPAFFVTGKLADRFPNIPLLFSISGAFACCLVILTVTSGYLSLLVVSAALGYVVYGIYPVVDTYLLSSLPDENRTSGYAIYSAGMMLAQAPGGFVLGYLISAGYAFDAVFHAFALAIFAVLAVSGILYVSGRFPTRE
jgi:DHA1 family inner membrane transport protein